MTPSALKHIRNQLRRYGCPTAILLVLPRIRETGQDSSYPARRRNLTGVYGNQQFHQQVVDWVGGALYDEDVFAADRFLDCDGCFAVGEAFCF